MRKIDTQDFRRATQRTSREVNRQIVLNLIREHQPISRADLARRMRVGRDLVARVVADLLASRAIVEEPLPTHVLLARSGRRPTWLFVRTAHRAIVVDVRRSDTRVAVAGLDGHVAKCARFATPKAPGTWIDAAERAVAGIAPSGVGVAVVVPGLVEHRAGRVADAPRLGWHDVDVRTPLSARLKRPVQVIGAPAAGALARLWRRDDGDEPTRTFAYVTVSDDVGVAWVVDGAPVQGDAHVGSAFGHVSLDPSGPLCVCGRRGCWEAFAGNAATVARYGARVETPTPSVREIVRRARAGERRAIDTLAETGYWVGRGLAAVIAAFAPGRIYLGGEIAGAWKVVESPLRAAVADRTVTDAARTTPIIPDRRFGENRVLGAVVLVAAPAFAAPRLA